LAAHLGRTLEELEESISKQELEYWWLMERIEPFGEKAAWIRHGHLMAMMANIYRNPEKTEPFKWSDFVPASLIEEPKAEQQTSQNGAPLPKWAGYFAALMKLQEDEGKVILDGSVKAN
jgi:hypothetical protein